MDPDTPIQNQTEGAQLYEKLKTERLIRIFPGSQNEPILLSEQLLRMPGLQNRLMIDILVYLDDERAVVLENLAIEYDSGRISDEDLDDLNDAYADRVSISVFKAYKTAIHKFLHGRRPPVVQSLEEYQVPA
ncbi:Hypothetical predicted protein [Lecanosticta acicola]|uniref:Uncharacterized protein n=1 Tax=Lecanosticta acicola TaxID=111012 RepID=A0AAI8Z3B0_9PEZI|nr:Hypothetical predicted protein [Lecanosticta acicola]